MNVSELKYGQKVRGPCAIFDIDGTLSDCAWRAAHLDHSNYRANSDERWAAFRAGIPQDKPIVAVATILELLATARCGIVLCTGRSEGDRKATEAWLDKYHVSYDALYMRAADCFRPDTVVKAELLDRIIADTWQPIIVFDDRQSVVDMWRSKGLVCAQVAPGNY